MHRPEQPFQIAAGAEAPLTGPGQDNEPHHVIRQGFSQRPAQPPDHVQIQAVEDPGTIEDQGQEAAPALDKDWRFFCFSHC